MVEVNGMETEMKKEKLKEEYKKLFVTNEPVSELEIYKSKPEFHRDVLESFGSWASFENDIGVLKRHLREKEKFELYKMFKKREKEMGEAAFDKNNIEKEVKEEIQYHFSTMKYFINQVLNGETEESVLYDAHEYFTNGGVLYEMEGKNNELRLRIIDHYTNKDDFTQAYMKKFLYPPKEIKNKAGRPRKETQENNVLGDDEMAKRPVGRPRKEETVATGEVEQKRPVGRPRKEPTIVSEKVEQKKPVGRPRKETTVVSEEVEQKRPVGRPRKEPTIVSEKVEQKKPVGRPRKETTVVSEEAEQKRPVGRPKKDAFAVSEKAEQKKPVGRPKKEEAIVTGEIEQKRPVGRPRKETTAVSEEVEQKRPVGRPKKETVVVKEAEQKRPVGRPKKDIAIVAEEIGQKRPVGRPRKEDRPINVSTRDITLEDLIKLGYVDEKQVQNIQKQMVEKGDKKRTSTL